MGWLGWRFGFVCFLVFCGLVMSFCYGGLIVLLLYDVTSSGVCLWLLLVLIADFWCVLCDVVFV